VSANPLFEIYGWWNFNTVLKMRFYNFKLRKWIRFLAVTSWVFSNLWRTSRPYPSDHHARRDDSTLEACVLPVEDAATGAGWVGPTTHVTSFQLPCFCGHRFINSNAKVKRRVPDIVPNISRLCFETWEEIAWYLLLCCEKQDVKGLD
jgi:hypothetical protein